MATRPSRAWTWALGIAVLAAAVLATVFFLRGPQSPQYQTATVRQGALLVTVSATGVLEPLNQVDVGSEVSGTVDKVLVDDNDAVTAGQILATLDTARLEDQVAASAAALEAAGANLQSAVASRDEAVIKATRLHRLRLSGDGGFVAQADLDAADAALRRAEASASAAEASVSQARATLQTSRTTLQKATIRAPIGGVVLSRKVEPGQTVAASLQAPVLFTLAEDMRRMELHVDVDEADVGQVRAGQSAGFTVDAYPARTFRALVRRVAYGAQTKEGVVTYVAVLTVDNADLALRPGMTASAEITSRTVADALIVPEAALRWQPAVEEQTPGLAGALTPRMPRLGPQGRRGSQGGAARVFVLRDGKLAGVPVSLVAASGADAAVSAPDLHPGDRVVTGQTETP